MKSLIVYYSLDGNTKLMAETMAKEIGAELLEIKPKKDQNPKSFMKFVWGGRQAMQKKEPELEAINKFPKDYELIIIGTPVWAWTVSPAIRSFLGLAKQAGNPAEMSGKKVAIFCCHGGQKGKTMEEMKTLLSGNQLVGETDFMEPKSLNIQSNLEAVKKWVKNLVSL
jgi:flavodoxin